MTWWHDDMMTWWHDDMTSAIFCPSCQALSHKSSGVEPRRLVPIQNLQQCGQARQRSLLKTLMPPLTSFMDSLCFIWSSFFWTLLSEELAAFPCLRLLAWKAMKRSKMRSRYVWIRFDTIWWFTDWNQSRVSTENAMSWLRGCWCRVYEILSYCHATECLSLQADLAGRSLRWKVRAAKGEAIHSGERTVAYL